MRVRLEREPPTPDRSPLLCVPEEAHQVAAALHICGYP